MADVGQATERVEECGEWWAGRIDGETRIARTGSLKVSKTKRVTGTEARVQCRDCELKIAAGTTPAKQGNQAQPH